MVGDMEEGCDTVNTCSNLPTKIDSESHVCPN